MIIYNYGLFWNVEDIFWGKPSDEGMLLGVPSKARSEKPVDFRYQSGIYALYADYNLIYIGQTGRGNQKLFTRLRSHRRHALAGRWNRFSWFGTRRVLGNGNLAAEKIKSPSTHEEALNHMEAILISVGEPPLNRQGGAWGKDVVQYRQRRDERLGPSLQKMIEELWKFQRKVE
ncbi:MAG: GIY-YIG nuclease family protein [Saprospiraceae bacterium]